MWVDDKPIEDGHMSIIIMYDVNTYMLFTGQEVRIGRNCA